MLKCNAELIITPLPLTSSCPLPTPGILHKYRALLRQCPENAHLDNVLAIFCSLKDDSLLCEAFSPKGRCIVKRWPPPEGSELQSQFHNLPTCDL